MDDSSAENTNTRKSIYQVEQDLGDDSSGDFSPTKSSQYNLSGDPILDRLLTDPNDPYLWWLAF